MDAGREALYYPGELSLGYQEPCEESGLRTPDNGRSAGVNRAAAGQAVNQQPSGGRCSKRRSERGGGRGESAKRRAGQRG